MGIVFQSLPEMGKCESRKKKVVRSSIDKALCGVTSLRTACVGGYKMDPTVYKRETLLFLYAFSNKKNQFTGNDR